MSTFHDWFSSNIHERKKGSSSDLSIRLKPYVFEKMGFHDAADFTAKLISHTYNNIFLSLSGGADSEYVVRTFHRNELPFKVLMVETSGNFQELSYAYALCKELSIEPIIITISDVDYLREYLKIVKTISGHGLYSVATIINAEIAKNNDGVCVIGEHLLDTDKKDNKIAFGVNEWDFYGECFIGEQYSIPFFLYTEELCYSMIISVDKESTLEQAKSQMYGLPERKILQYEFSSSFRKVVNHISSTRKIKDQRNHFPLNDLALELEKFHVHQIPDTYNTSTFKSARFG